MRRVVITGRGAVSCLGNDASTIAASLRAGRSGIRSMPEWERLGFRSRIAGQPDPWAEDLGRLGMRTRELSPLPEAAKMGLLAALSAIAEGGLERDELRSLRSACIAGCGVSDAESLHDAYEKIRSGMVRRVSPYGIVRCMSNAASAAVTSVIPVSGLNLTVGAACATSAHAIGIACQLIRADLADVVLCGGSELAEIGLSGTFDAMRGVLSAGYNECPERASRPFDRARDGFVLSSGAGMLVLEDRGHALERGAEPIAEVLGLGVSSDGHHLTQPDPAGRGASACMSAALRDAGVSGVDYINAHATSTPLGDAAELRAIRDVFGPLPPPISSTKSMGGHAISAAGALEVIHCTEMMRQGFLAPSINLESLEDEFFDMPILACARDCTPAVVMSNSLGFGGTNACLILGQPDARQP